MINYFFEIIYPTKYLFIGLFLVLFTISFFWKNIFKYLKLKNYNSMQRIHIGEIPRLGGLIIYIFLWILWIEGFIILNFFKSLLLASIPFFITSSIEDLFHNTSPKLRLTSMIISCLLFFYLEPIDLPIINVPFIGQFISVFPTNLIFFTFSALIVMNGFNFLDGVNGLSSLTSIFCFMTLTCITFFYQDEEFTKILIFNLLPLFLFLIFNFPFGKIFIGDFGAYFFGFAISMYTIYIFGKYNEMSTWYAVLILFYPCFEVLFSFIRKIFIKKISPFTPDKMHLHSLVFFSLKSKYTTFLANNLTTIILLPFAFMHFLFYFLNLDLIAIFILIFFEIILYLLAYKIVQKI